MVVNLRIRSEYTRRLGIEMHICELQLILMPFATLKVAPHERLLFCAQHAGCFLETLF